MLNIGFGEIILIAALLLVVVGPERLPKLLRMAGQQYAKLRRAAQELQTAFMDEGDLLDGGARRQGAVAPYKPVRPKSRLGEAPVPADPAEALEAARGQPSPRQPDTVIHENDSPTAQTGPATPAADPDPQREEQP